MEDIFNKVSNAVRAAFSYPFHFQCDPDADDIHYVRMYGVPDDSVMTVKKAVRRLIAEQVGDSDETIIPSICSLSNTTEYYPEYLPSPTLVDFHLVRSWDMIDRRKERRPCHKEEAFVFAA